RQKGYERIGSREEWHSSYDYVIVGAGSAGSVVAHRLSAIESYTVLVLESGAEETIVSTMPSMSDTLKETQMDWNYTIVAQNYSCFGLNNRTMKWPRGRALGGTSAINRMELGAKGWQWSQVLPHFLRSENETDPTLAGNGYHSTGGPLTVSTPPEVDVMTRQWVIASNASGYEIIDMNGSKRRGTGITQRTVRDGSRQSSSDAFLAPIYKRKNLHILTNTLVTRILFDRHKRAVGVEFLRNGHKRRVKVKKEVIVSAGVINSPQLLMLSGIGPKSHLESLKIKPIVDLPVGDNLHDHPRAYGVHFLTNATFTDKSLTIESLREYLLEGKGALTRSEYSTTLFQSSFVNETDWPDIQMGFMQSSPAANRGSGRATGIRDEIWDQFYKPYTNRSQFSISVILLRPKSRGTLRLRSSDPFDKLLLNPNYFAEEDDVSTIAEGMAEAYRIARSPTLRPYGVEPYESLVNGCESYHNSNFSHPPHEYLKCVARTLTSSAAHIVGTCKMGATDDPTAVVDPHLRVKGVANVRVIDASVMPRVVSANTNAATVMIGEYGAQLIIDSIIKCLQSNSNDSPIIFPDDDNDRPTNRRQPDSNAVQCKQIDCHSPSVCFLHIDEANVGQCVRTDGTKGVCCEPDIKITGKDFELEIRIPKDIQTRRLGPPKDSSAVTLNDINTAQKVAIIFMQNQDKLEIKLRKSDLLAKRGSGEFAHQNFFGANPRAVQLSREAMIALQTAKELSKEKGFNVDQSRRRLSGIDLRSTRMNGFCPQEPECISTKYRSSDGTCNNRKHRLWGKSMITFNRLLEASYSDGINEPRVSVDGSPLPSARDVSLLLAPDRNRPNNRYTLMVMQLGQFIDHDLTHTASTRTNDNHPLRCCGEEFRANPQLVHPSCFPISVAINDPFYEKFGQKCMNFIRSAPAIRPDCQMGPREQLNQLTAYLDASNIYGSTEDRMRSLRSGRRGRLRVSIVNKRQFLPFDSNGTNFCGIPREERLQCFVAGDSRVNEQ
ncbi:unnamed protein product, partial [Medioppia subpectinata]